MERNNDIWFDLCLGNVSVDEEGGHYYRPTFSRLSLISTRNITSITLYRDVLHELLDKAIDYIEENQKFMQEKK